MKKRDYLRSLGFRVGERGRFTDAMKTALATYEGAFEEDIKPLNLDKLKDFSKKKDKTKRINKHNQEKHREARTLVGYTADGTKVGFVLCSNCHQHMVFCECRQGIHAPSIVKHSKDSLVFIP
jgi:hypothetical protein